MRFMLVSAKPTDIVHMIRTAVLAVTLGENLEKVPDVLAYQTTTVDDLLIMAITFRDGLTVPQARNILLTASEGLLDESDLPPVDAPADFVAAAPSATAPAPVVDRSKLN